MMIGMVYDLRDDYIREGLSAAEAAEFDSEETISAIQAAIAETGHETDRVGSGRALCERLVAGDRWDIVFNVAEGLRGRSREAQVPALLEMYGIPYTFSDPLVCALTLDKAMTKRVIQAAGLRTPAWHLVEDPRDIGKIRMEYPLFAKPVAEGTGKGVSNASRSESPEQLAETCLRLLAEYDQPVLVEEYLPGREFTTGVLGTGRAARILGTMEIRIRPGSPSTDYSYEVKERCEEYVDYIPAEKGSGRKRLEKLALQAYRVLQCRDAGRVDIRMDRNDQPSFIEVNPLPGLHPTHSDLPMIAAQESMSYERLIAGITESASLRVPRGTSVTSAA